MAYKVVMTLSGFAAAPKTAVKLGAQAGLRAAAEQWKRRVLPGHFTLEAKNKYGYRPRTAKHEKRKARVFGHRIPLVFSGKSQMIARAFSKVSTRGKGMLESGEKTVRATVRFPGLPRYFYVRYGAGENESKENRPFEEMTRMIDSELAESAAVMQEEAAKVIREYRGKKRRKIA